VTLNEKLHKRNNTSACTTFTYNITKFPYEISFNLMFVPCIIRRSRNNQHYAQICTTALFYTLAPTCFGINLPSSGSFRIRLSYMKIHIDLVVYHIMFRRNHDTPAHRPLNQHYMPPNRLVF
jgi:hypothetical protein